MSDDKFVTCNKCGWVHFQVSKEEVNEYIKLNSSQSVVDSYTKCGRCGNSYKDFRDSKDGDCPRGCTIQCILSRGE